ncbi:MAG: hypothetical protein JNL98_27445 [Bryobacterales bacterium]|nr:hypothetical protein [Bryobacterales bacterium]
MVRLWLWIAAWSASALHAQQFTLGGKGGFRVTTDIDGSFGTQSESKRHVVGPTLGIALGRGFGVSVDALYSTVGYRTFQGGALAQGSSRVRGGSWEFPIAMQRYFREAQTWRPFTEVGFAPRHTARRYRSEGTILNVPTGVSERFVTEGRYASEVSYGLVVGGGVQFAVGAIRIAPCARYTRWNRDVINEFGSRGFSVNANRHQVQVLVGISWAP